MKKVICVLVILLICGCSTKPYHIEEQKRQDIKVSKDSYLLADTKLETIEKSKHEKESVVYYVQDEKDLAKVLQIMMNKGKQKVAFQSKSQIDLDKTAKLLTYFNPYDISLQLSTTEYKDGNDEIVYRSNVVEIKNLDDRFAQAQNEAKRIYASIITEDMDNDQKISVIHDYLVKSVMYNTDAANDPEKDLDVFKAAGALVDRNAVCAGYSRAFMILARMANVPAMYVASDTMNHGWNLVYGNDGWRYIDVTWDDPVPDMPGKVEKKFETMPVDEFLTEGTHIFDNDKSSDYYLSLAKEFFNKN